MEPLEAIRVANRWVPDWGKGKEPLVPQGTDLEIWTGEVNGVPYAIGYMGKAQKPLFHVRYRNEAERDKDIAEYAEARRTALRFKEKKQQERREYKHDYEVGAILYSSWGYEQTNIDFYEVTKILGPQMVEIREIGKDFVGDQGGPQDKVMPDKGNFIGPPMRKRVSVGGSIRLTSYASAYRWDGKPKYQTGFGWGH